MKEEKKIVMPAPRRRRATIRKDIVPIEGANRNRFAHSLYWLAYRHTGIAFRHVMMLVLMGALTIVGGWCFLQIERPAEQQIYEDSMNKLNDMLKIQSKDLVAQLKSQNGSDPNLLKNKIRTAYHALLTAEERYTKSVYFKVEDPDANYAWKWYSAAVFFCTNAFMTVDYGTVPAVTDLGRLMTICFTLISIPLAVVVTRDLGQAILYQITKMYSYCARLGTPTKDEPDGVSIGITMAVVLMFVSWFSCAAFTYWYDGLFGPNSITYWGARDPAWKFVHFFVGMPFRIVNRCTFVGIEKSVFGAFKGFEQRTEALFQNHVAERRDSSSTPSEAGPGSPTIDVFGGDFGRVRIAGKQLD
ncbi:unnamed protein product, partial [Mesorhabditis spiculigera]